MIITLNVNELKFPIKRAIKCTDKTKHKGQARNLAITTSKRISISHCVRVPGFLDYILAADSSHLLTYISEASVRTHVVGFFTELRLKHLAGVSLFDHLCLSLCLSNKLWKENHKKTQTYIVHKKFTLPLLTFTGWNKKSHAT